MDPYYSYLRKNLDLSDTVTDHLEKIDKSDNSLIQSTLNLLEEGEKEIVLSAEHSAVSLVLGNTGSGKSTFTQWIAGDNNKLISVEVNEGTGEYIIEDNNRIGNSTLQSKTIFPELVVDPTTNAAYYDCPGFSDTRSASNDIATTYFIKKVVDYAESVKLIFIISYPSVRKGVNREDFMKLMRHATDLVKDVGKFKDSIAVVASKVDNQYVKKGNNLILVEDDKVIKAIADFLLEAKEYSVERARHPDVTLTERNFFESVKQIIDILLLKDKDQYSRIGIFRRPDEPGPLSNISLLSNGKKYVNNIIYNELNFTRKDSKDFGYTLSDKSKIVINDLVDEINKNLWSDINNISEKMQEFYRNIVEQVRLKLKYFLNNPEVVDVDEEKALKLKNTLNSGYNITSDLIKELENLKNPDGIANIIGAVESLGVVLYKEDALNIAKQGKYLNFLQTVSDKELHTRPWAELFKGTLTYISDSSKIIQGDVREAADKMKDRIQTELQITTKLMQEYSVQKMEVLDISDLPNELTKLQEAFSNVTRDIKSITSPKQLVKTILRHINILQIQIPKRNILNIANSVKYFEILQIVSDEELKVNTLSWSYLFEDVQKHLHESEVWYKFLNDLYAKLSEYEVQKNRQLYNVADLEDWGTTEKPEGISITRKTFDSFLTKIENFNLHELDTIRSITISETQLEELNHVLKLTLKHKVNIRCEEPYIFIEGDYISLQEALTSIIEKKDMDKSCKDLSSSIQSRNIKFINIFARNTLFFDDSLSVTLPMHVIAPKWEVVGSVHLHMNRDGGKSLLEPSVDLNDQIPSKAKNGSNLGSRGEDGIPGRPGKPGANFFGVAQNFVNGANLTITSTGGTGSPGQEGGNGHKGIDGPSPSVPLVSELGCINDSKEFKGFKCERGDYQFKAGKCDMGNSWFFCHPDEFSCTYTIFGKPGGKGGDGGNGGRGGKGGSPGIITIFELNENSPVLKRHSEGKDGLNGAEGKGGVGGRDGDDIKVSTYSFNPPKYWTLFKRITHGNGLSGRNGIAGANDKQIEKPKPADNLHEPYAIINQYKYFLRENLDDRFKRHFLLQFQDQLNNNVGVKNMYNTLGLVNDLQGLEKQFHALNKYVDFVPLYESLLQRIKEYAQNPKDGENSVQYKKVLSNLYTATLGRIYNLKENSESSLVVDINGYLDLVRKDMETLGELQRMSDKVDIISKSKENYKSSVDRKIEEAKRLIINQIIPEINNVDDKIDYDIDLLITETLELQKTVEQEKEALIEKQRELENSLAQRGLFGCFKIIGEVVSFLGPVGEIIGSVIQTTSTVSESLLLDNKGTAELPSSVVSDLKSFGDNIITMKNRKIADFHKLIQELSEEINQNSENLGDMSGKLEHIKTSLNKIAESKFDWNAIEALRDELKLDLKRKEEKLKELQVTHDQKIDRALQVIDSFSKIVTFGSEFLSVYSKYKNDKTKVDAITDAIDQKENEMRRLQDYEANIYKTLVPLLENMQGNFHEIVNELEGKSKVNLDVTKWQVQSALKDIKLQMQHFTDGFEVKEDLTRCIEKLDEVMTTLMNIYDRIQSYQEQQNLANYIADISSPVATGIKLSDSKLQKAVIDLEILIRSNLVLQQYKTAIDAFKQWVFPFAHNYLQDYQLPTHLKLEGSVENLVTDAVKQIEDLKSKIGLYKTSINKTDEYIQNGEFSSRYVSTDPFFVWENEKYGSVISNLLSGREVVMKADVIKSAPDKDAIKFSLIELGFKSKNKTLQTELNYVLKEYDIKATHLGSSYYRFADKIFLIPSESQTIRYSFEKNSVEEPLRKNNVYQKIRKGDLMLSPYALWELQLVNATNRVSFHELKVYQNAIDLELTGYGSYVVKEASVLDLVDDEYKEIQEYSSLQLCSESSASTSKHSYALKHRCSQLDSIDENNYFATNGAAAGLSSPLNDVCNFFKMHFLSHLIVAVNQMLFNGPKTEKSNFNSVIDIVKSDLFPEAVSDTLPNSPKVVSMDTHLRKSSTTMLEKPSAETFVSESISSLESYNRRSCNETHNSNYSTLSSTDFLNSNKCFKSFLLNEQRSTYEIDSFQKSGVDINYALLLADLVTRSYTGKKYETVTAELLTPQQLIRKKINDGVIQSERDIKENLYKLLSEMENKEHKSWYSTVKNYFKSAFQFIGLIEKEDIDVYVEDIRNLFIH
ncbi:uncharacterized protein NPIL_178081 [Nephila pilipes]|uniref:Uncharacterized protein n=1 Tax=Nephila pilipes TaxID=299642 RepID=A0A8X6P6A1_NEPPI|nr:uncharacterized protein NPIL_178081 [Nephila pilipes]